MKPLLRAADLSLYELPGPVRTVVASTPETRSICNDPLIHGLRYTESLKRACARILAALELPLLEEETNVVHLLRGGLNFGLREALGEAHGWNRHTSTFLSAQRRRKAGAPEEWEIGEADYRKFCFPRRVSLLLGDVVASGASLRHGLEVALEALQADGAELRSVVLFTIGGPHAGEVLAGLDPLIRAGHPSYEGATVVYLEGRFPVASTESPLRLKITGTDLLRQGDALAPEFVASQYESPAFPLERCTIYDAGSRAFDVGAYLEDVLEYWEQVASLQGVAYQDYLEERCPGLEASRFEVESLAALARRRVGAIRSQLT